MFIIQIRDISELCHLNPFLFTAYFPFDISYLIRLTTSKRHCKSRCIVISFIQYIHLIYAPFDRASSSAWLYKHTWITCPKNKNKPEHINDPRCLRIKVTSSCEVIPAFMPRKLGSYQARGGVLCPSCHRI